MKESGQSKRRPALQIKTLRICPQKTEIERSSRSQTENRSMPRSQCNASDRYPDHPATHNKLVQVMTKRYQESDCAVQADRWRNREFIVNTITTFKVFRAGSTTERRLVKPAALISSTGMIFYVC